MRVLANGSVSAVKLKIARRGNGFLSATSVIERVLRILLATSIGTAPPFSAMSGTLMRMSPLSVAALAPMALSAADAAFASNAALGHSEASAAADRETNEASTVT